MTIEGNQQILTEISSQNSTVMEAARTVYLYTEMCKKGQLSQEEYVELISDIQRHMNINNSMIELENLQKLNTAINGLITIARLA